MKTRASTPQDLSAVEALLCRSYPAMMAEAYEERLLALALPFMMRANPDLLASGTFHVVEEDGRILGCGGWTFGAPGSGETIEGLAHLRHFAVDPACARQGIGRALFAECARAAAGQGALRFQAFSGLNAEPFYARMGLKRLEIVSIPMAPGVAFPVALMEGRIDRSVSAWNC